MAFVSDASRSLVSWVERQVSVELDSFGSVQSSSVVDCWCWRSQGTVKAMVIMPNQALRLRARKECTDREGARRVTGEEWLVKKVGSYMPGAYEEVVGLVSSVVLTDKVLVHDKVLVTSH